MIGLETFYGMSKSICIQTLSHFEGLAFNGPLITVKIDILRTFTPNVWSPSIFDQISWNLHQITTAYRGTKL